MKQRFTIAWILVLALILMLLVSAVFQADAAPVLHGTRLPTQTKTATQEPTGTATELPEPTATETELPEPTATETEVPRPTETSTPEPDIVVPCPGRQVHGPPARCTSGSG